MSGRQVRAAQEAGPRPGEGLRFVSKNSKCNLARVCCSSETTWAAPLPDPWVPLALMNLLLHVRTILSAFPEGVSPPPRNLLAQSPLVGQQRSRPRPQRGKELQARASHPLPHLTCTPTTLF